MGRKVLLAGLLTFFGARLFGQQLIEASNSNKQLSLEQLPTASILDGSNELKLGFAPNPFSDKILINLLLPESGKVSLRVFDILGKQVATITDELYQKGQYILTYTSTALPAGRYYLHLSANREVIIKQLMKKN